jgi:hypothetical protein
MDGYVFTKDIVITDDEGGGRAIVLQILWSLPDDSSGKDLVVFTERCSTSNVRMRSDGTVWAHFHARVDYGVGSDGNGGV